MTAPYLGQIMMISCGFAPNGWALCNGTAMSFDQNSSLYQLIGMTYGGQPPNGPLPGYFNLPDLQSRLPIHQGQGTGLSPYNLGQNGGVASVTLTTAQMPPHNHPFNATPTNANSTSPSGNLPANALGPDFPAYLYVVAGVSPAPNLWTLGSGCVGYTGGGGASGTTPHSNMMPSLCVSFCIALQGVYPQQA